MRRVERCTLSFSNSKCRVKSEFAKESDPNYIMKKYRQTGQIPTALVFNQNRAIFGDFSATTDFTDVMRIVDTARNSFNTPMIESAASLPSLYAAKKAKLT